MPDRPTRTDQSRPSGGGPSRRGAARASAAAVRAEQERARRRRTVLLQGGVALALVVVVLVGAVAVLSARDRAAEPASAPQGVSAGGVVTVGEEDAPVTVRLVEDFQCPACAAFEAAVGDRLAERVEAGEVQVEHRPIAFLDRASTTEYSSRALGAALAVLEDAGTDAWAAYHELLFAQQPPEGGAGLDDEQLVALAVEAGADEAAVAEAVEERPYDRWIDQATEAAFEDGVSGTPTVYVDGVEVQATPEALDAAVDAALAS